MNDNENPDPPDRPDLIDLASSIADGQTRDWARVHEQAPADQADVIEELRSLEALTRISEPMPQTWGSFLLREEIGRGSFGTVYRATDPNLQIDVALKVIRPRRGLPIDLARALNEARLLAQINHPNVARVYRGERIGDEVGVAMELLRGETLAAIVKRQGPFSAREALNIGVEVSRALAAVHGAKLLHGDVKAHNVMRGDGGRTVLMDFGAGSDLKDQSGPPDVAGTPIYLAPEVFAGKPRTALSDIYSVGVLLYYLVTAAYPVEGTTRTEIERRHDRRHPRRPLRDLQPNLPDAFIRLVDRILSERPGDRPASAGAMEKELQAVLGEGDRRFPWRLVAALVGVVGVTGLAVSLGWVDWPSSSIRSGATPPDVQVSSGSAPPSPTVSPPPPPAEGTYVIDAALYREADGQETPLRSGARVAPGDRLSLQLSASVPTFVYIVNEDEQGESTLLFPLPGLTLTNPLPAGQRHRLPGEAEGQRVSWEVSTVGGREHFMILASREPPSPAFQRMFSALPKAVAGRPVIAHKLSRDGAGTLRAIGGLKPSPPSRPSSLDTAFAAPLIAGPEAARGVWVRQLTLENPGR